MQFTATETTFHTLLIYVKQRFYNANTLLSVYISEYTRNNINSFNACLKIKKGKKKKNKKEKKYEGFHNHRFILLEITFVKFIALSIPATRIFQQFFSTIDAAQLQ